MLLPISPSNTFEIYVDNPKNVIRRLYESTKTTEVQDLAKKLFTDTSTIKTAIEDSHIPMYWLLLLHATENISPVWILDGKGDMYCKDCYFDALGICTSWV